MYSPPMHLVLYFMLWFAVASVFGGVSYWFVCFVRNVLRDGDMLLAFFFALVWALIGVALFDSLSSGDFQIFLSLFCSATVALLICTVGAISEGAIGIVKNTFFGHVTALFCAIVFAIGITVVVEICIPLLDMANDTGGIWGLYAGLITTPATIPTFIWLWRSSRLRPGIDRHLNSSEELTRRS